MAFLDPFKSEKCPKCGFATFHRLGDSHSAPLSLIDTDVGTATSLDVYVKVCRNCAFTEFYARRLIDEFEELRDRGGFGEITKAPSGGYLLSIFVDYEHDGRQAHDFTIPLTAEQLFHASLVAPKLPDAEFVRALIPEPYLRAWTNRIGKFPKGFAINLRGLLKSHFDSTAPDAS